MADLKTEFQTRYSDARVIALTNPDRSASKVDHVRLDAAVSDALVEFIDWVGAEYIENDPRHIKSAVLLVEVLLIEKGSGGIAAAAGLRSRTEASLTRLNASSTTSRQGIQTNMQTQFRKEHTCYPMVPWSDASRWGGYLPSGRRWTGRCG
jgi:hypothetical protein